MSRFIRSYVPGVGYYGKFGAPDSQRVGPDGRQVVAVNFMHDPPEEYEQPERTAEELSLAEKVERLAVEGREKFFRKIRDELERGSKVVYFDDESVVIEAPQAVTP